MLSAFTRLAPQMEALDRFLQGQLVDFEPEIRDMIAYCIDTSGKRIRPSLVFISGWAGDEAKPNPDLIKAAAIVELVHLASLVHDDIMDNADIRRSRPTASRKFGATPAVLLGDALFSHALNLATQFPTNEVCAAVSDSMRKVCAGEIVQTMRRGTANVSREDYFRVIDLKTAELFRLSCHLGSRLAGRSDEFVKATASFGRHLGIAYQIYDDLADFFGEESRIGKTLGTDLESGKLTLPLFALHDALPENERPQLLDEITGKHKPDLRLRVQQMHDYKIFPEVMKELNQQLDTARSALAPYQELSAAVYLGSLVEILNTQVSSLS